LSSPPSTSRARNIVPSAIVLGGALVFSVLAHSSGYVGLGILRGLLNRPGPPSSEGSEIEFILTDPPEVSTAQDSVDPPDTTTPTTPAPEPPRPERQRRERPARHAEAERPRPRRERERPPEPEPVAPTPATPTPPAELPPPSERAAVAQHSQDPDTPPPADAQYIAEENNTVEEETMATITSATHDDPVPSAGPPEEAVESDVEGDSSESVAADMRDSEGSDARRPTPEEAERTDPRDATDDPSTSPRPTADATGTDAVSDQPDSVEAGSPSRGDEGGARALGGAAPTTEVMITDGYGSYTVRVPVPQPPGTGGGTSGGHHRDGSGLGVAGRGALLGHVGQEGGSPRERGSGDREGPRLGLSYTELESVYGEDQLEHERHARLERRRSHSRGSSREEIWEHFRAAMENYIAEVRPGNQTALNAAASPFARFLHDMHVRIHQEFAERYLGSLGVDPPAGLNDESLHTVLEIAVNTDGSIYRVGIVETSGNTLYDLGAFTAVWRAQPFPHPPSIILSGDGHAWLHWRFDRGPRHCGTWNAEPFLIDNGTTPPATGTDEVPDEFLDDEPQAGSPIELQPGLPSPSGLPQ
jgi:hypothetical protein